MPRLRRSDPTGPGIRRRRRGRGFGYLDADDRPVRDPELLARIAGLAIPPAWTDVWICPHANGHIQATGVDAAGRRQYLYHPAWRERMDRLKHDRALALAEALPAARRAVTRELRRDGPGRERVLAGAFRLLDTGMLRIGSERGAAEHGSFGLSTLRVAHVAVRGEELVELRFPAKSGQAWESEIHDPDLAALVRLLARRGPRARLLAWRDEEGAWHPLSAAEINDEVRRRTGDDFTAKDFRTLHGTIAAARSLARSGPATSAAARRRSVSAAIAAAAAALGNTPAIARASYVDPRVLDRFEHGEVLDDASPGRPAEGALRALLLGGE